MLNWKHLHHSFEYLWSKYRDAHPNPEIGLQVLRQAMNPERYSKMHVKKEVDAFRLRVDLDRDWQDIEGLREAFEPLADLGFSADTPAESVYQTAIQVRLQRLDDANNRDGDARWFYRGQRDHRWDAVPKIFRDIRDDTELTYDVQLGKRLQVVRSIVGRIMQAGLAEDEFEATAIAQHYSSELGVQTWLLDVTASPWIALFFASDGGKTGEIGILEYIELTEWMLFSNRGESALGKLRVTSTKSILRINNQQAFFLQAPHPQLLKDLVNRRLYFLQEHNVVFESDAVERPVNRDLIYPTTDATLAALHELPSESLDAKRLTWEPTVSALRAPDFEAYLPIARALLERESDKRPDEWKRASCFDWDEILYQLCALHATVRAHHADVDPYTTTLHHLRVSVLHVLVHGNLGVSAFLEFCYGQYLHNDTGQSTFRRCLQEASPFWARTLEAEDTERVRWPGAKGQATIRTSDTARR
jgi:FRG domain